MTFLLGLICVAAFPVATGYVYALQGPKHKWIYNFL